MSGRRAERGKRAVRGNLKEHMQARSTEGERGKEPSQKKKKKRRLLIDADRNETELQGDTGTYSAGARRYAMCEGGREGGAVGRTERCAYS